MWLFLAAGNKFSERTFGEEGSLGEFWVVKLVKKGNAGSSTGSPVGREGLRMPEQRVGTGFFGDGECELYTSATTGAVEKIEVGQEFEESKKSNLEKNTN